MQEKLKNYAVLLLKKCLNIKKDQPLLISAPIEAYEFIRILSTEAYNLGVTDIYYDFTDDFLKYNALKNCDFDVLKNNPIFNKEIWNIYAKKNAAFLMLNSFTPDLMDKIDGKVLSDVTLFTLKSEKVFREKQMNDEIPWLIACVATKDWALKLFPDVENPLERLWNEFFDICGINKENSLEEAEKKLDNLDDLADKLNSLKLRKLHYKNSLGTDLIITLHESCIWQSARTALKDGSKVVCNFPSEEVYTVPYKYGTNGIVYSSKPLIYNGKKIDKFFVEFKDGKVISYDALIGKDILKELINSDKFSNMLGEVALVEYDSPISKRNRIFYTTLLDENASCHIALGEGYASCIKDGINKSDAELEKVGVNKSVIHVDFMIGTSDLEIIGESYDNKKYQIFRNGNFDIKEIK